MKIGFIGLCTMSSMAESLIQLGYELCIHRISDRSRYLLDLGAKALSASSLCSWRTTNIESCRGFCHGGEG